MKSLSLFLLGVLFLPVATAQNQSSDAGESAEEGEVIVIAELNRREVRQFIEEVEDQLYEVYNAVNDDDDFDIFCFQYKPTTSNIRERVCEPRFFTDARAENAKNSFEVTDEMLSPSGLRAEYENEFEELTAKMEAAAAENPQIAELANILNQLRARQQQLESD